MSDLGFLITSTDEHLDQSFGVDVSFSVDLHGVESLIDFLLGELVSPGHQGFSQAESREREEWLDTDRLS